MNFFYRQRFLPGLHPPSCQPDPKSGPSARASAQSWEQKSQMQWYGFGVTMRPMQDGRLAYFPCAGRAEHACEVGLVIAGQWKLRQARLFVRQEFSRNRTGGPLLGTPSNARCAPQACDHNMALYVRDSPSRETEIAHKLAKTKKQNAHLRKIGLSGKIRKHAPRISKFGFFGDGPCGA